MSDAAPSGDFNYPTSYRIGAGRVRELPAACAELGITRPLLVTDPGLATLPWLEAIRDALGDAGLAVEVFTEIDPNPTVAHVEAGLAAAQRHRADGCLLVGGGSAMDVGKCVALLAHNPGGVLDYEDGSDGWRRADPARILPTIATPTTAGTGSEVGRAAVIVDPRDRSKKIVFHPRMQPDLVLADPELCYGLSPRLTAATGMDALAHCFEAFCAPGYHPMADGIALEGMRLIGRHLVVAFEEPRHTAARTHMLMAAAMGATAFQKGLGLIHALSHPLGGVTGLHHGTANAIFLPYVMVHNRAAIEDRLPRVAQALGLDDVDFDAILDWSLRLRDRLELPHTLEGVLEASQIPRLVPMAQADPSLATNPVPCSAQDLEGILRRTLAGDLSPARPA